MSEFASKQHKISAAGNKLSEQKAVEEQKIADDLQTPHTQQLLATPNAPLSPSIILQLQRTIGNRAVQRFLSQRQSAAIPMPNVTPKIATTSGGVVQRGIDEFIKEREERRKKDFKGGIDADKSRHKRQEKQANLGKKKRHELLKQNRALSLTVSKYLVNDDAYNQVAPLPPHPNMDEKRPQRLGQKTINDLSIEDINEILDRLEDNQTYHLYGGHILIDVPDADSMWEFHFDSFDWIYDGLRLRQSNLLKEPHGRSGISRASNANGKREDVGAAYKDSDKKNVEALKPGIEEQEYNGGKTKFKSHRTKNTITNIIVHAAPWGKGVRRPSQIGVMFGLNAKNYIERLEGKRPEGRYEWLHLIGSSLGGPNLLGNLVAGSYDANTEMIPLEHRIAHWGSKDYKNPPTSKKPVIIMAEAQLIPDTFVAQKITLTGQDTEGNKITRTYDNPQRRDMLTREEYKKLDADIGKERGDK